MLFILLQKFDFERFWGIYSITIIIYSITINRFLGRFRFFVIGKMPILFYCNREIQEDF